MSMDASKLFFKPNWMGVKRKLKIKLSANGSATIQEICLLNAL
jgi:hypothetical protein